MSSRAPLIAGITAFVLGALLLVGTTVWILRPQAPAATQASAVGGPFQLTDQDGRTITEKDFLGHPLLVFFGFTHCPDVCPTTLFEISEAFNRLGPDATRVSALFVSIDPERDTPELLKNYVGSFNPSIRGATGDQASINAMVKAFRAYVRKVPLEGGDYTMDHTAIVYLMDKEGRFVAPLNLKRPDTEVAAELRRRL